ncbi:hypothetical protein [Pseudomonas aeruginosa]|uniref:hypothetical protein n=1 Tax=Pseudomonas aeruginosa TaxID=287 RepID=UPI0030D50043
MSEVKRYHFESFIDSYYKHRQFVLASDYDTLAAEAQALREELAALRARVVVLPSVDNVMNIVMRYQWNEKTNVTGTTNWAANLGMRVVEEVKRLNGKTVSERLLLRVLYAISELGDRHLTAIEMQSARELRALLSQDKENGNG